MKELNFSQSVDVMFNRAASYMDLSPKLLEKIRVCNATYTVRFGVKLRGEVHTFTGYRAIHSEHGPVGTRQTTNQRRWRRAHSQIELLSQRNE